MLQIRYTRNLFLRVLCVVYLFAFVSFYIQIPGLYGDNGVLPARAVLENSKHKTFSAKIHYQPTLLWLAPYVGLDTNYALDVVALLGVFLAFTGFISQRFCTIPLFLGLWSLYFSLYQIGQVFVSQWDNLLLETGILALFIAPAIPGKRRSQKTTPKDHVGLWLLKWTLFRFLFSSGLTKLMSGCPKWWDLTALNYFFETTVLPTPLSWYSHHIPTWILKLLTLTIYAVEIITPFFFFSPIRSLRISSFVIQVFLQITTFLTGNYQFLNILLMALLICTLDDQFFSVKATKNKIKFVSVVNVLLAIAVYAVIVFGAIVFFNLKFTGSEVQSSVGFSRDQLNNVVKLVILYGSYVALFSIGYTVVRALASAAFDSNTVPQRVITVITTAFWSLLALVIFAGSTVPLASLHSSTNTTITPNLRTIHTRLSHLNVLHNYGFFKKIPSVNGRPEIIIEGSHNIEGPWHEYSFLYKPGNVNNSLPFVAPYSPRLDWQMWWSAQTTYQKEPWLLSLVHRLLLGKPEVLSLLDRQRTIFSEKPPKYIRGVLYNYKFTGWEQRWQPMWWKRERVAEYFPIFTKETPALIDTLKARNLLPNPIKLDVHPLWQQSLDSIRYVTSRLEATLLMWSIFTAGCAIISSKNM